MEEWIEAQILTTSVASFCITEMLTDAGVNGFAIEDSEDFEEFLNGAAPNWDFVDESLMWMKDCDTKVIFYIENSPEGARMLDNIKLRLNKLPQEFPEVDLGLLELKCTSVNEEDWSNEWKKYYHPIRIGERLVICPDWEEYKPDKNDVVLRLNPGMAFGTGQHDTTAMCMKLLENNVSGGESVLDVGCGSGILAISALLLGADSAKGVDIDELAAKTAAENAKLNNVNKRAEFYFGTLDTVKQLKGAYDVVCMNIVADVIINQLEALKDFMAPNAHLLLSGIINTREDDVISALKNSGYKIQKRLKSSDWLAFDCTL